MRRSLVLLAPWVLLAMPVAGPLAAQVEVDFTPRVGVFFPLEDLTQSTDPFTGLPLTQRAQTKFNLGGTIGVWLSPSFGFEGTADYNRSGVEQFVGGVPQSPTIDSHFFAATGRAMARLGANRPVAFILSAGAGLVDRGGDFTNGANPPSTSFNGRTDFAGAGGIGVEVRLSRWVKARLDGDVFTYKAQYSSPAFGSTSDLRQWDAVISFGFTGAFRDYGIPTD
ncbi:MAG TPA: hypothetical protein VFW66_11795 [Gemmatimonadales bacterium]|nr:hypothetical protein [Gemmatimonadales bacterium]